MHVRACRQTRQLHNVMCYVFYAFQKHWLLVTLSNINKLACAE